MWILFLTWTAYAGTYLLRKPLGVAKSGMVRELGMSSSMLGMMDMALLMPYALVQMFFGHIGDRLGPRMMLLLALVGSGVSMMFFGQTTSFYIFLLCLLGNGSFQSMAWANCVKRVSLSYDRSQHATVMGILSTSGFGGGLVGTALAVHLLQLGGWSNVFFAPAAISIAMGFGLYFILPPDTPAADQSLPTAEKDTKPTTTATVVPLTIAQLLAIPMMIEVTLTFFFSKLVRYAFYMWLPMYLARELQYNDANAGWVSMTYEVGAVIGSGTIGIIINKLFNGNDILAAGVMLLTSTLSMIAFVLTSSWGFGVNCLFMTIIGAASNTTDPILSATVPLKFARSLEAKTGQNNLSQIAGFINGMASCGPIFEGLVIGVIADKFGWSAVFNSMTLMCLFATIVMFRVYFTY